MREKEIEKQKNDAKINVYMFRTVFNSFAFKLKHSNKMEEQTETLSNNCCTLCGKPDHEVELIEIESNSLKYGEIIVEFADLLFEVFQIKVNKGSGSGHILLVLKDHFFFRSIKD